jgi:hypothetical protein
MSDKHKLDVCETIRGYNHNTMEGTYYVIFNNHILTVEEFLCQIN